MSNQDPIEGTESGKKVEGWKWLNDGAVAAMMIVIIFVGAAALGLSLIEKNKDAPAGTQTVEVVEEVQGEQ